ncbi:MAG: oligosaccharide flippase family protein [Acidobacteria bacterium]|nr:oligosaccharide flippase family protein [Acidobacteriota bacterium]
MADGRLPDAAFQGTLWNAAGAWVEQLFRFGVLIALARLISASDFGLFALASSVTGILLILAGQGLTTSLVQVPRMRRDHLDTAFWSGLAAAVAASALVLLAAWGIRFLVAQPELPAVLAILALAPPLNLLGHVPLALLRRKLDFRSIAMARIAAQLMAGTVALAMAVAGLGVWSLVARSLVEPAASAVVLWVSTRWRPRFSWRREAYRDLARVGGGITFVQLLRLSRIRLAEMLIGLVLGTRVLGFFSVARRLMESLAGLLRRPVGDVAWAMLARVQEEPERLKRTLVERLGLLSVINLPALGAVLVLAVPLVRVTMGERWLPMASFLRALAVASLFELLEGLTLSALTAVGAIGLRVVLEGVVTGVTLGALWMGLGRGGSAAAWAFACGMGTATVLTQVWALRRLPLGAGDVARAMAPGVAGATAPVLLMIGTAALLPPGVDPVAELLVPGLAGGLLFLVILRRLVPGLIGRARDLDH